MGLRETVGHRPLLQVGASVIAEDAEGRILLQKRADTHDWAYHGGSVELDERVEDAARREFFEETGLRAGKLELYGVFSGPEHHVVYPNGDECSCVDIVYITGDYTGTPTPQEGEVEELRYFRYDSLPENLFPATAMVIRKWAEEKRLSLLAKEERDLPDFGVPTAH